MNTAPNPFACELRLFGARPDEHSVPVEILVRTLQGLQQTAVLLVAADEQAVVQSRFRPSEELRRRCELRCGPPRAGSIVLALSGPPPQPTLPGFPPVAGPAERLLGFVRGIADGDPAILRKLAPASRFRARALREVMAFLPRGGQSWEVEFSAGNLPPFRLDGRSRRHVAECFDTGP